MEWARPGLGLQRRVGRREEDGPVRQRRRRPLAWLAVQVQPSIKGRLVVRITSAPADAPLYEVQAKARPTRGSTVEVVIKTEEEPLYRQFFTRVGQLCGRPVAP
jgi:hypothetical protein